MALKKYEVMSGRHVVPGDPKSPYKAGEVVEVDEETGERTLAERFVNKFREVQGPPAAAPTTAERKAAVTRLIDEELGDFTEADRPMLESLSKEHFDRLFGKHFKGGKAGESEHRHDSPLGTDVTDMFGLAYDHELKVYVNDAGLYNVTQAKGRSKSKPLNTEPLAENKVEAFLADYLKG